MAITAWRRAALGAFWAFSALLLAGCVRPTAPVDFPPIGFTDRVLLPLDVARIDIVDETPPAPQPAPHVGHLFPTPPAAAARAWARDRLQAAGTADRVGRFTIQQASAIETRLPRTGGVRGAFTKDQTERYDVGIEVRFELLAGDGSQDGFVSARAERARTVEEGTPPDELRRIWHYLTLDTMRELDQVLEAQIRGQLGRFLR
jgi:hypothetical protein